MMKTASLGSRVRKRLSDITNLHSNPKSPLKNQENSLPVFDDFSTKNYVQQLLKENAMMTKLIQEKDKIIESNGVELQTLRVNLQKMQQQNWHLAQTNTQMLAELNMSKDRWKAFQHDLACKDAVYKAKLLEAQEKTKIQFEENSKLGGETRPEKATVNQPKEANDDNENKVCKTKVAFATRRQSLGAKSSQEAVDKEVAENKRRSLRRHSVRLNPEEPQADLIEIDVSAPLTHSVEHSQPLHASNPESDVGKEPLSHSLLQRSSTYGEETKPEKVAVDQPKQAINNNESKVSGTKRGRPTRSQSLGATSSQQAADKEIAENKRRCLRRQSFRLKPVPQDSYEKNINLPLTESSEQPLHASEPKREDVKEPLQHSLLQKPSIGRPSRKATGKIQSYKDPPLNVKMRRP